MSAKIIEGKFPPARRGAAKSPSRQPATVIAISEHLDAKKDTDATDRLYRALCLAAEEAATRALCAEGRAQLLAALLPGIGPGWHLAWSPSPTPGRAAALDAARDLYRMGEAGEHAALSLCKQFGVMKLADVPAGSAPELMAAIVAERGRIEAS